MESVKYNPKDKEKGIFSVSDFIKDVWSQDPDLAVMRTDFKPGPGASGGPRSGTDKGGNLQGQSRIIHGLKHRKTG